MKFLKTLFLGSILSITATAVSDNCPTGWLSNTFRQERCCSGSMVIDDDGAYCCVNDMRLYKEALTNTALLYPTTTKTEETNWSTVSDTCFATVRFTASDYSAQVSSAASKAEATPTDTTTTTATGTGTSSGSTSQTSTPTSNAAMPLATAEGVVLGGAAIAAALFL